MVKHTLTGAEPPPVQRWPPVPARTQRRWQARWLRPARGLAQVLAACGEATWAALATGLASAATCADLVAAWSTRPVSRTRPPSSLIKR